MSYPIYMVPSGDVLPIFFDSFDGGTGASITMSGLAVTDIEIYKDGSVTQRASDAGYTLLDTDGIDFDGITGIHGFSIDTGDNTDAGFYTVGAWFHVVVSAITVDAQTVNFVAAAFRIMAAEGVAGVPDVNTTHISDTAQTSNDVGADVNEILTDTGTTLQAELDGIQADTEDIQSKIGTPAGASVSADILTLDNLVDDLESRIGTPSNLGSGATVAANLVDIEGQTDDIGAAGAGLTAIPWNAAWDAEVQSEVQDALVVNRLDELLAADSDINGAQPPTVGSVYHEVMSKTAGSFTFDQTTDSLEAVRDNMGTAQTGDSFARLGAPAGASVSADIAAIEGQTDDIGAAGAGLTAVPWNAAWDAEVQSEVADALEDTIADSVAAAGSRPTIKQALLMITRFLFEMVVSGTTATARKEDGSTTSMTFTLDDGTNPTDISRTT